MVSMLHIKPPKILYVTYQDIGTGKPLMNEEPKEVTGLVDDRDLAALAITAADFSGMLMDLTGNADLATKLTAALISKLTKHLKLKE
jgi:hypothetical protein